MNRVSRRILSLLITVLAVAVAAVVRGLLTPILPEASPLITLFPAVAVASWYGGIWPGLFTAVLGFLVADWLFIPPPYSLNLFALDPGAVAEFVVFIAVSGVIIGLNESLRRAKDRAEAAKRWANQDRKTVQVTLTSIGDGVIATDVDARVSFMNPVAESLTGWNQDDARGRPLAEVFRIVNEQSRQTVEDPCAKVLRTGRIVGLANHTILIAKDASELPIDDSAAPISDEDETIWGVVLVFRDATKQRNAYETAQRLAAIVEDSDDAIIGQAIDGTITSWNKGAERLYGYTAEEALGKPITLVAPPDRHEEATEFIRQLQEGKRIDHWDTVRMRKDGSLVDVSVQISPIRDLHGKVVGASKVARDITDRKRQEAALAFLAETSATLAGLVDGSSALQRAAGVMVPFFADWCVLYTIDRQGQIEHAAHAHRDPEKRQLLGSVLDRFPADWNSAATSVQALRTGQSQFIADLPNGVVRKIARSDEELAAIRQLNPRSIISVPLLVRGETIGAISFVRSLADRRYSPVDVPFAEDLARRVATAIDNAHLFNSVKVADRQKDEFLAMLAHELRNPLAAIRYATDVVRLPDIEPKGDLLDMIERQVEHLTRLIEDLLDISRISRDKIELRREQLDASTIARRAAATIRPRMEEKKHRLVLDLAAEPLPILGDPTRVEQIIGNLLINAAKYTPQGGQISLTTYAENGETVIKVKDNGMGIAPDILPHVFDLFTQADKSLDRSQGGLGIGLSVVRKLTEMHGGTVIAESLGVGEGSEFTVRLPLSSTTLQEVQSSPAGTLEPPAPLRILVVEDNRDTAQVEAMLLRSVGHEVQIVYDGLSAVAMAERFRPHAMLVDIGLPGLNGYEVAKRVRQDAKQEVTLIAVSGYGQAEDQKRSLAAGFDHHLVKPVEKQALLTILRDVRPLNPLAAK
jgi:PAS domain S-box-containing protein